MWKNEDPSQKKILVDIFFILVYSYKKKIFFFY